MPRDFQLMYAVHDAVRRDLVRIVGVLGGSRPVDAVRAAAVAERWDHLAGVILRHHADEDSRLWPAAREVLDDTGRELLDRLEAQHAAVTAAVEETSAQFAALLAGVAGGAAPGRAQRDATADSAERVLRLLDAHFAAEEDRLLPALAGRLDDGGWDGYGSIVRAAAGSGGTAAVLPWLLDDAPPARVSEVLDRLPDHVRASYAAEWRPAYRERVAAAW